MTKTFTDSEGREYEEVSKRPDDYDQIVIRPIPQKPKWEVSVCPIGEIHVRFFSPHPTEDQAQLIKAKIEKLLEEEALDNQSLRFKDLPDPRIDPHWEDKQ